VIKLDIINRVADKTGVPKMKAEQAVEALFHSMKEALTGVNESSYGDLVCLSSNRGNAV